MTETPVAWIADSADDEWLTLISDTTPPGKDQLRVLSEDEARERWGHTSFDADESATIRGFVQVYAPDGDGRVHVLDEQLVAGMTPVEQGQVEADLSRVWRLNRNLEPGERVGEAVAVHGMRKVTADGSVAVVGTDMVHPLQLSEPTRRAYRLGEADSSLVPDPTMKGFLPDEDVTPPF